MSTERNPNNPNNPNNRINLDPMLWGEWFWMSMYSVAYSYPSKPSSIEIRSAKDYYSSLQYLLPCGECRDGYMKILRQIRLSHYLTSRNELLSWVNKVHNAVNTDLEVKNVTLDEILEKLGKKPKTQPVPSLPKKDNNRNNRNNRNNHNKQTIKIQNRNEYFNNAMSYPILRKNKGCKSCGGRKGR